MQWASSIASVSSPRSAIRLTRSSTSELIIYGDEDQIVPINASARTAANIVKDAVLKVYPGAPHGLAVTHETNWTPTFSTLEDETSSDCCSGALIRHVLSVAQVGRPKTFGKPLDDE
jgi:dienelactone hydrolase